MVEHSLAKVYAERQSGPTPNGRKTKRPSSTRHGPHGATCGQVNTAGTRCAPTLSLACSWRPHAHARLCRRNNNTRGPSSNIRHRPWSARAGAAVCGCLGVWMLAWPLKTSGIRLSKLLKRILQFCFACMNLTQIVVACMHTDCWKF
jgi:hypothetical protein